MPTDFELGHILQAEMTLWHAKSRSGDHWIRFTDAGVEVTLEKSKNPGKTIVKIRAIPLAPCGPGCEYHGWHEEDE